MFIAITRPATPIARARMTGPFTSSPITSRRDVSQTSGTTAKGSTSESTTWLATSVRSVSAPAAITISAGIIVISRRTKTDTCQFMKPSTIICPASVPTVDDESPEARSAIPNAAGASGPRSGPRVA